MAKRRHTEDQELPFVALMDTMTNVVGVLIIVLVMVGITLAASVKKILSDLPPVTVEQHAELKKIVDANSPKEDPKKLDEEKKKIEEVLAKVVENLKTLDLSREAQQIKFIDLDAMKKQLADTKKERDAKKAANDALLAQVEKAKALLDQTPTFVPPPATVIRLPNPRPYPEKPNETKVLVAKQGALYFNQNEFLAPIIDGLEKTKAQLQFQNLQYEPFAPILENVLGSKAEAVKAWPKIGGLVNTFQMEQLAQAYKALSDAGFPPTKQYLSELGDIAAGLSQTLPVVAEAVAAASAGNLSKWIALDPGKKGVIKASTVGTKVNFTYGSLVKEVRASPQAVQDYFKDLAKISSFKDRTKALTIYDNTKVEQALARAASNPFFSKGFAIKPVFTAGATAVKMELTPAAGGGETLEQMKLPTSNYQKLLRQVKADPNGVVVFQVMTDAVQTYHDARRIADEAGVAATWEFLTKLQIDINLTAFQVQRMVLTPKPKPVAPGTGPAVVIKAPPKALD
ncbi:MAG: hypothetical protein JWO08_2831 [Verrucomicrobiaceae bacterium]|nr:hypothetical protein [Verrucomicrobiaceae bacterium]